MKWSIVLVAACALVIAGAGFAWMRGTQNVHRQEHKVDKQYASLMHDLNTAR